MKIMKNNTLLFASPITNDKNTSWSLNSIQLPDALEDRGYNNPLINSTIPYINEIVRQATNTLNITFIDAIEAVVLSNASNASITVYKITDNNINIRQKILSTMKDFVSISPDGKTIIISLINSALNQYNEEYYVQMDNNFVKRAMYVQPLKGIANGIWRFKSDDLVYKAKSSETATTCLVLLTVDGSHNFTSKTNRTAYFDNLLNELAFKVPVRRERLSSDYKFQNFNDSGQILISISIDLPINENENTVLSDLNNMIKYKNITTFFSGTTNDLDEKFGFQVKEGLWDKFKPQIIAAIAIFIIYIIFYILSYKLYSKKYEAIGSAILRLGLIISNFIFSILFIVYNSTDKPEFHLYILSVILLSVSLLINFCIAIYTVYNRINDPVVGKDFKDLVNRNKGLVTVFTILAVTDYEYLIILKDVPRFKVAIDYKYLTIRKDVPKSNKDTSESNKNTSNLIKIRLNLIKKCLNIIEMFLVLTKKKLIMSI
ncbi:hypothetical protein C2G38_1416109 [Gigaspora rosea]|uniref:Uncharacterized protein n=1 Tax=Gigaspora rosea TaxID=44941 RepID=A0A397V9L3_9GLOM|nr:hypothetical protein C2G38_1416109 [Gigaspora rosea]